MSVKLQGWDLSLNHAGFIEFTDGKMTGFWYVCTRKTLHKRLGDHGYLIDVPKCEDALTKGILRLNAWGRLIKQHLSKTKPTYIGIENYAYGKSMRAHQIGELGGLARLLCFNSGIKLRLHDPYSIKMFVTGHGHADKPMIEKAVRERWGQDFSQYNPPTRANAKKENREASEDLADAFGVAKLVWTETQLRTGDVLLKDLEEKEIRVFNRVTKPYPINILARDWIHRDAR